ncbi:MAG: hypothetical protein JWO60_3090 [Frankiales bacterium]|nr:hypothetical protein [Frankiales bacterium]
MSDGTPDTTIDPAADPDSPGFTDRYTYAAAKPPLPETVEQLRARIPGWGVDLDEAVRPDRPKLQWKDDRTGAHWDLPEQQPELRPRERSVEHGRLTPVFGTAQPLKGLSGVLRRASYGRYSEGQTAHFLLLLAADRVDAWEGHLGSLLRLRPDNPVTETGIATELTAGGVRSRLGRGRYDVRHTWVDPVVVAGPWLVAGAVVWKGVQRLRR